MPLACHLCSVFNACEDGDNARKKISGDRISSTKLQKNANSTNRLPLHTYDSSPQLSSRFDTKFGIYGR